MISYGRKTIERHTETIDKGRRIKMEVAEMINKDHLRGEREAIGTKRIFKLINPKQTDNVMEKKNEKRRRDKQ